MFNFWNKKEKRVIESYPTETIFGTENQPYISVFDKGEMFGILLHKYDDGKTHIALDKKCIPGLVSALNNLRESDDGRYIKT
jgi:hypothetical protein